MGQSDPFTRAAVQNACNYIRTRRYSESNLLLDFKFITERLKILIYQSSSVGHILQQLDVLEIRFENWYCFTEAWPGPFNIGTPFLIDLTRKSPKFLALQMSEEDHV